MVGYNHKKGMSNNAVTAQQDGRMPLSKITISMLRKAGWEETKKNSQCPGEKRNLGTMRVAPLLRLVQRGELL